MADRFELVDTTLADRYRVDALVAEGGFASVYRAFQLALDRPVAIKVLKTPAELDSAARARFAERFASEARTIAHLRHAHIVDVYDFGVTRMPSGEVAPWMALEWLDGETLEMDLERRRGAGGRSAAEAVALIRPVVGALAYAHSRGVIHRDIKPANLMIVATETGPVLRMLDFGIAKTMRAQDGDGGSRPGGSGAPGFSPDYASPEQVTYSRTGPWTDVHALGLVLTELLTDEPPFSEGPDELLFEQIMAAARPTPRRRGKDVGALETIVAKAVALSPRRRWRDAGALLAALDSPAARHAVRALRPPRPAVTADVTAVARRHSSFAVAGAGGLAVLALFTALVSALATSDARRPSAGEELALAAAAAHGSHATMRSWSPLPAADVAPWIVPLPACPTADAAAGLAPREPMLAARRPARPPRAPLAETATPLSASPVSEAACTMTINSVPWSQVWIDGRNTGRHTPFVDYEVDCGPHRIEFRRPDLALAQSEAIVVRPGQTFKRRYTLGETAE
jgi:tRNA A-37 threonylcarbamoyl transferase component Bud32